MHGGLLPVLGLALNGTSSVLYGTVPELAREGEAGRAFALFYTWDNRLRRAGADRIRRAGRCCRATGGANGGRSHRACHTAARPRPRAAIAARGASVADG
jgi:hypothetical protein